MKILFKVLKYAAAILVCLIVLFFLLLATNVIWRSPPYYTNYPHMVLKKAIMTTEEYASVAETHRRPYIVRIENERGGILVFGSEHTRDPGHPQLEQIRAEWKQFKPTVALVEGRLGFLFRWFMDPVERLSEGGLVFDLARMDGLNTYSWDPPLEKDVA